MGNIHRLSNRPIDLGITFAPKRLLALWSNRIGSIWQNPSRGGIHLRSPLAGGLDDSLGKCCSQPADRATAEQGAA